MIICVITLKMTEWFITNSRGMKFYENDLLTADSLVDNGKPIVGICVACAVEYGESPDSGLFKFSATTSLEEQKKMARPRKCYCEYNLEGCVYLKYIPGTLDHLEQSDKMSNAD